MAERLTFVHKVIMIGCDKVGKSSLMTRLTKNQFQSEHIPTMGVEFAIWIYDYEGKAGKLQIWDLAGNEMFKSITKSYYPGAKGVFVIYDITNKVSFQSVPQQVQEVREISDKSKVMFLIGNKSDLEGQREISIEEGQDLADSLGMTFIETSALNSSNVEGAFIQMGNEISKQNSIQQPEDPQQ